MTFQIGAGTGAVIDGRDVTAKSNTCNISDDVAAVEDTTFHRSNTAKKYISGLQGGTVSIAGYLPVEHPLVEDEMQTVIGNKRDAHLIAVAPFGFGTTPGNLAVFNKTFQTQWQAEGQTDGCCSMSASFEISEGVRDGIVLHSPHASAAAVQEVQTIAVVTGTAGSTIHISDADGNATTFAKSASASTVQTALSKLKRIGYGGVTVGLSSGGGTDTYTLTFSAHLGNVGQLTTADSGVTCATTTQGQLENLSIITATGNGTAVDQSAATTTGWTAQLNVIHATGTTPTLDVVIEHSSDNLSWATLATFSQKTMTGSESLSSAAVTTTVNRYVRAKRTISGTNPKFAYSVCLSRHK